jgi:hypothetical protein
MLNLVDQAQSCLLSLIFNVVASLLYLSITADQSLNEDQKLECGLFVLKLPAPQVVPEGLRHRVCLDRRRLEHFKVRQHF